MLEDRSLNETQVLDLAANLLNHTNTEHFKNPVDIAATIDNVGLLVQAQVFARPISKPHQLKHKDMNNETKSKKQFKKSVFYTISCTFGIKPADPN